MSTFGSICTVIIVGAIVGAVVGCLIALLLDTD